MAERGEIENMSTRKMGGGSKNAKRERIRNVKGKGKKKHEREDGGKT